MCIMLRTPMKYITKLLCWWDQSEAWENYCLLYNGLKMLYRLDQKVFCMVYLKKTLASVDKRIQLKILLKDKTADWSLKLSTLLSKSYTWELNVWCDSTLTCILDQLPGQISEIQAFAACHVELIYCRRSAYLVDNFVRIKEISVHYPSLNHIALPKKLKDSLKVYVFSLLFVSAYIFNNLLIYYKLQI